MEHIKLRRLLYAIAYAANRLEIVGAGTELFPEPFDVGVDGSSLDTGRIAPDTLEKRISRLDAPCA